MHGLFVRTFFFLIRELLTIQVLTALDTCRDQELGPHKTRKANCFCTPKEQEIKLSPRAFPTAGQRNQPRQRYQKKALAFVPVPIVSDGLKVAGC